MIKNSLNISDYRYERKFLITELSISEIENIVKSSKDKKKKATKKKKIK